MSSRLSGRAALARAGAVVTFAMVAALAGAQGTPGSAASRVVPDSVMSALRALRARGELGPIATLDSILLGNSRVAAGDTIRGSLVVHGGSLELGGVVDGSVAVVGGDLVVISGALITGSASAVGGTVRLAGGQVAGEIRSLTSTPPGAAPVPVDALDPASVTVVEEPGAAATTWRSVKMVATVFGLFLMLGVGILIWSQPTLDNVVRALEHRFAHAFWTGLLAQFAILPVLLLIVTLLAISIVGILLIPFAVVAYTVVVAGLIALGFLAAARLTGGMFGPGRNSTPRGASLRGMVAGLFVYFGVWMAAAGLTWHPLAGTALRAVALALTWVAVTVGLGAIISAGLAVRRARADARLPRAHADAMAWQTPTPITGVVPAARPSISPARRPA